MAFLQLTHHLSSSSSPSLLLLLPFNHQTPHREREKPSTLPTSALLKGTPSSFPLLTHLEPPPVRHAQDKERTPSAQDKQHQQQQKKDDFYLNLGTAVRTLREDMPLLFSRDLNYDIYRQTIYLFLFVVVVVLLPLLSCWCSRIALGFFLIW